MKYSLRAEEDYLKDLSARIERAKNADSPASSLGQWIGALVSKGTTLVLRDILKGYSDYSLMKPDKGKKRTTLINIRGQNKEIDDVIVNGDNEPVIISESKWLKDARHLNDKGAWVALLPEVKQANETVKGAISILAGPWDAGNNIEALGKVVRVVPITIKEVYRLLSEHGIDIEINEERNTYLHPKETLADLLTFFQSKAKSKVDAISSLGLELVEPHKNLIKTAIDEILALPEAVDMIDSSTINEIEVIYKTKEGLKIREVYKDAKELIKAIKKHFFL